MLDLDEITEDIGLGRFQLLQQLLVSGVRLADGAEILISSAVLSILQQDWEMSPALKGSMMSVIFIGVFFGNLIGGPAADTYGRRVSVLLAYFGLVVCGLSSAASTGPSMMLVARFFFGLCYGFGMGPSLTLQVEICPKAWRGHMVNVNNFFFTLGEIYAAWLLWAFLKDLKQSSDEESWRYVTALAISPALLIFPFALLLLYESPHYLVTKGRHEQALAVVRSMAVQNGQAQAVAHLEVSTATTTMGGPEMPTTRTRLIAPPQETQNRSWFDVFFRSEFCSIIIGGSYICFLANFLFFGLTYAMPQVFRVVHSPFHPATQVLVVTSADLPACLLASLLIRSQVYGHRDSLTALAIVLAMLLPTLMIIEHGDSSLVTAAIYSCFLAKCAVTTFFTIAYVYVTEIFPSSCRCTAASACMAGGRVGSILAPFAFEVLAHRESHLLFWLLSSLLCIGAVLVIKHCLTFELKGEPLEDVVLKRGDLRMKRPSLLTPNTEKRMPRSARYTASTQEISWKKEAASMSV